ncbi:protein RGF1 INDUCIBLE TRANSCRIPTION FACTOR 1-like [Zingiber officinale]|uniref:protein RGF1 INDUCIBLE TRANSCRIPTION FACTOR 1-like n=1 Tax=Zingiber officinale TaxID=94328 RepID=UPI001C4A958A|nr:protein RGF1 INDUCIBLE TRANSCRIPTION FACTOR 1-like [Zingiber officinale]
MMMRRVAASLVPPWLEPLLSTRFFAACPVHPDAPRSECNMFCLDCGGSASSFCFYCRSDRHSGHRVIQIRRSSYHDVVRVAEIQKELDISGVQTYVINSARVLFLNERPQPRGGGRGGGSGGGGGASSSASSPHICEICARSLLDPFRFCSLGCKLVGIKRNGDATFLLTPGDEAAEGGGGGGESSTTAAAEESKGGRRGRWGGGSREGTTHDTRGPAPPPPPPATSRRRKGIPHRAPFAS